MTVTLYNVSDEPNRVRKRLGTGTQYTGVVRDTGEVSVTDPVILVSANLDPGINYACISDFSRYYYVKIRSVRVGLVEISCHVDVLFTYKNSILEQSAIIARQENNFNLLLTDGMFRTTQKPRIATYNFPSGFNQFDYVIALAGD